MRVWAEEASLSCQFPALTAPGPPGSALSTSLPSSQGSMDPRETIIRTCSLSHRLGSQVGAAGEGQGAQWDRGTNAREGPAFS